VSREEKNTPCKKETKKMENKKIHKLYIKAIKEFEKQYKGMLITKIYASCLLGDKEKNHFTAEFAIEYQDSDGVYAEKEVYITVNLD
jgi:hypothetical protein